MYAVFILFDNGHVIKLEEHKHEENARQSAEYHAKYCGNLGCSFEVWHKGDLVFSTGITAKAV